MYRQSRRPDVSRRRQKYEERPAAGDVDHAAAAAAAAETVDIEERRECVVETAVMRWEVGGGNGVSTVDGEVVTRRREPGIAVLPSERVQVVSAMKLFKYYEEIIQIKWHDLNFV